MLVLTCSSCFILPLLHWQSRVNFSELLVVNGLMKCPGFQQLWRRSSSYKACSKSERAANPEWWTSNSSRESKRPWARDHWASCPHPCRPCQPTFDQRARCPRKRRTESQRCIRRSAITAWRINQALFSKISVSLYFLVFVYFQQSPAKVPRIWKKRWGLSKKIAARKSVIRELRKPVRPLFSIQSGKGSGGAGKGRGKPVVRTSPGPNAAAATTKADAANQTKSNVHHAATTMIMQPQAAAGNSGNNNKIFVTANSPVATSAQPPGSPMSNADKPNFGSQIKTVMQTTQPQQQTLQQPHQPVFIQQMQHMQQQQHLQQQYQQQQAQSTQQQIQPKPIMGETRSHFPLFGG